MKKRLFRIRFWHARKKCQRKIIKSKFVSKKQKKFLKKKKKKNFYFLKIKKKKKKNKKQIFTKIMRKKE